MRLERAEVSCQQLDVKARSVYKIYPQSFNKLPTQLQCVLCGVITAFSNLPLQTDRCMEIASRGRNWFKFKVKWQLLDYNFLFLITICKSALLGALRFYCERRRSRVSVSCRKLQPWKDIGDGHKVKAPVNPSHCNLLARTSSQSLWIVLRRKKNESKMDDVVWESDSSDCKKRQNVSSRLTRTMCRPMEEY